MNWKKYRREQDQKMKKQKESLDLQSLAKRLELERGEQERAERLAQDRDIALSALEDLTAFREK